MFVAVLLFSAVASAQPVFADPVPGAVAPATAPSRTDVDGVIVTSVSVVSKKDAAFLKQHFTELFDKRGLYLAEEVRDVELANSLQVTGLDPDTMTSYTVLLQPGKKGFTTVLMSSAELAKKPMPPSMSFAPVMPGAAGVTQAQLEWMQTLSYQSTGTPAEIKAFYRQELGKLGYREIDELMFEKPPDRISLTVQPGVQARGVFLVKENASRAPGETPQQAPAPVIRDGGK